MLIEVLKQARGLNAEDYDGSRWADRLAHLRQSPSPADRAHFDAALTVCVMRYLSDLHIGRVNPQHFKFNLDISPKKYGLPAFLRDKLIHGADVRAELDQVEPPFAGYKRTQSAMQQYMELSRQDDGEQLPVPAKPVDSGGTDDGVPRLTCLLRLLGDLPDGAASENSNIYTGPLVDAVKHFQARHGLGPDGRLGTQTLKAVEHAVELSGGTVAPHAGALALVPYQFPRPPIVVNIPESLLRAYDKDGMIGLSMNVIVGKAYRHETPDFERDMKYIVFRPSVLERTAEHPAIRNRAGDQKRPRLHR
jgi:L,D-transpeptidase YcbB